MNPSDKKPFKLLSPDRKTKKGVVAASLEELIVKGKDFHLFLNINEKVFHAICIQQPGPSSAMLVMI